MTIDDPTDVLKGLSENYRSIRLKRGVVGKTGQGMLVLLAIWGVIVWQLSDDPLRDKALFIAGLISTGVFWWWVKSTQEFAEKNPAHALLEGAELSEYKRFETQFKGITSVYDAIYISDPSTPTPTLSDAQNERADDA
jgi:hypothetical protein